MSADSGHERGEIDPLEENGQLAKMIAPVLAVAIIDTLLFAVTTPGRVAFTIAPATTIFAFTICPIVASVFASALVAHSTPRHWSLGVRRFVAATIAFTAIFLTMTIFGGRSLPDLQDMYDPWMWDSILEGRNR